MKTSLLTLAIPLGMLALLGSSRTAMAADQTQTSGPNRSLLRTGFWTLGLSYVPAVIVAAESSREGDKNLYIPVAGPWMDLAARSDCPPDVSCNNETVNKVLIIIDGVFQGLGALDIVGAFIFPETRTVARTSSGQGEARLSPPSFRVSPAQLGASGYGLTAVGTF